MYFGSNMTTVDIILPAYNPLPGWEDMVVNRFLSLENQLPELQFKLIVVNDGSSKINQTESVEKLNTNIISLQWISYAVNKGKGYALRKGVDASTSDYIIYTDIDWPYKEASMIGLINNLLSSADAVVGIRDDSYYDQLPPSRRRLSKLLKKFNAGFLRLKVDDTQAGLKGFRKNVKETFLATTIDRYLFDLEFIYLLSRESHFIVKGYPIVLRPGISFSKMKSRILLHEAGNFLKIWLGV